MSRAPLVNLRLSTFCAEICDLRKSSVVDEQGDMRGRVCEGAGIDKNIRISESRGEKIDGAAGNGGATVSSVSVIGGAAKKIEGEGEEEKRDRRAIPTTRIREERQWGREGGGREVCSVWERRERDGTRRRENNARTRRCRNAGRILLWRWENFLRIIIEMAGKFCWEIIKN